MADDKTKSSVSTVTTTNTVQTALAHLKDIEAAATQFQGKPGYNPYFFHAEKIAPLIELLHDKKSTVEQLAEAVKAAHLLTASEENFKVDTNVVPGWIGQHEAFSKPAPGGAGVSVVIPPKE